MADIPGWKNKLYFGDNLGILREHVQEESVDLIYLDPPFNSKEATAGFYEPEHFQGRGVPKLQILNIEELLSGKRPELPRFAPSATFKQAPRKKEETKQGKLW